MIQKIKYILTVVVGLWMFSACDLNLIPESDLSDEVFWQTDADFRQATNNLYKAMINFGPSDEAQFPLMADVLSDNAITSGFNNIANGTYLPTANFGPWDRNYIIIRIANNIIEKANSFVSTATPRYRAEARFFRAWAYADLVRRYGDVPLIMKTLDTNDTELYAPRTSRAVVIDSIYSDLDYASVHLPVQSVLGLNNWGMVTKGVALAFKSRVALREGTWNKFHNNGNFNVHLQAAKEASLKVIQSGEYQLFNSFGLDSYRQLFKIPGEGPGNKETIWTYQYGVSTAVNIRNNNYPSLTTQGWCGISKSLVDDYLCMDGLPIAMSPLYQGRQSAYSEFENRDPRLNGTVLKPGDRFRTGPFVPNMISPTGYMINKGFDQAGTEEVNTRIDIMLIRYGEILLNYAEATFELNDAISDGDLNISINLLRDRVGMPHLTNAFIAENNLVMRNEIRRERRVELGMEGFRYDDLLRWKTAEIELPKEVMGIKIFPAEYPTVDPSALNLTSDSIVIVEEASKRNFNPTQQYLWPLPLNQLALNPNLVQNPNW